MPDPTNLQSIRERLEAEAPPTAVEPPDDAREGGDWIDSMMEWTSEVATSPLFRLWAAIGWLAGALERRVWMRTSQGQLFPNLYILLVARPGIGKTRAIKPVEFLWRRARNKLHVAPNSMNAASMMLSLQKGFRAHVGEPRADGSRPLLTDYHALCVASSEFSQFCPTYDNAFLGNLNDIFDAPESLSVSRVYLKGEFTIARPCMTILAGAQPNYLASVLPQEAWTMGYMSRQIMIYAGEKQHVDFFAIRADKSTLDEGLIRATQQLSGLYGEVTWETDAAQAFQRWYDEGMRPVPLHLKLQSYCERRDQLVLKLALVASIARAHRVDTVTLADVERAIAWLVEAEMKMPDVFRDMSGRNDSDLMHELHQYVWKINVVEKRGVEDSLLVNFLHERVPIERIFRLLEVARAGCILRRDERALYWAVPQADKAALGLRG